MNNLSPHKAYSQVTAMAKAAEQSLRAYCAARDVNHSTVCKWKGKRKGTVFLSILEQLNGPPKQPKRAKSN